MPSPFSVPSSRRISIPRMLPIVLCFAVALSGVASATVNLACKPGNFSFGKVAIGRQKTQAAILANTGSSGIKVLSLDVKNSSFKATGLTLPVFLKAGASIAFTVAFTPKSAAADTGEFLFKLPVGSLAVPAYGRGVSGWSLSASPSSLAFGDVAMGNSSTLNVTLTNQGESPVTISEQARLAGEFTASGPALPITLDSGQAAVFKVTFSPKWRREVESDFWVSNTNDPVFDVPLSGSGGAATAPQLNVSPSSLNFGSVTVGDTSSKPGTITAAGGSVTVSAATLGSSLFSLHGISLPLTLTAGQSDSFDVVFTPQTGGSATSALKFVSTAEDSPVAETLSGSGTEPAYSVNLSWDASTSQVAGYNVYRSSSLTGSYSRLNPSVDAATRFTDGSVASGATYYYDVTSVSTAGVESSPCTPVKVTVN